MTKKTSEPWTLTKKDLESITRPETVWGTVRLLPPEEDIPKEFWKGNIYTRIAEAMFFGEPMPEGEVTFNPEFEGINSTLVSQLLMSHLVSFQPKHEHKIAGVGYMISKITTITE